MKTRYRNYALWASLISQLALAIQAVALAVGVVDIKDYVDAWVIVANIILGILTTLGIISNPTKPDSKGYNL